MATELRSDIAYSIRQGLLEPIEANHISVPMIPIIASSQCQEQPDIIVVSTSTAIAEQLDDHKGNAVVTQSGSQAVVCSDAHCSDKMSRETPKGNACRIGFVADEWRSAVDANHHGSDSDSCISLISESEFSD